jgi:hypothetical protein
VPLRAPGSAFRPGFPYAVGALDHHAAALGSGLGTWADASLSTGTVLAALVLVDEIKPEAGCIHGPDGDGRRFYRLTFDPQGAGQVEDYRRTHAPGFTIEQLLDQAERASVSPESPIPVHGAAMLELLQRIAHTQKRLLAQVAGPRPVQRVTATGGGARSPFWLQLTADTLGVPLVAGGVTRTGLPGSRAVGVGRGRGVARSGDGVGPDGEGAAGVFTTTLTRGPAGSGRGSVAEPAVVPGEGQIAGFPWKTVTAGKGEPRETVSRSDLTQHPGNALGRKLVVELVILEVLS